MRGRRLVQGVAGLAALTIALSGCGLSLPFSLGFGSGSDGTFDGSELTVPVLHSSGAKGGVTTQRITAAPADGAGLSIDITENDVSGVDAVTQSGTWAAVTAATLLTGAQPDTAYTFGFDARVATPAAGAITAVGVLALYFDTDVQPGVALAGTVTPLGTIGPVAGLPEMVSAAIDAGGIDTILVPAGQRTAPDATGSLVDLDQLAATGGMTVSEVADVATAYSVVTGADLPASVFPTPPAMPTPLPTVAPDGDPDAAGDDDGGGDAADAVLRALTARLETAVDDLADPAAPGADPGRATAATAAADRAATLQDAGDVAGAIEATAAALDLAAAATAARVSATDAAQLADRIAAASEALLDQLFAAPPASLDEADALLRVARSAVDAYALSRFAAQTFAATGGGDAGSDTAAAGTAASATTASVVAASALQTAEDIRPDGETGEGADTGAEGALADGADLTGLASLLRRATIATEDAADAVLPTGDAESAGGSTDAADVGDAVDLFPLRLTAIDATREDLTALATAADGAGDGAADGPASGGWAALSVATSMYVLCAPVLTTVPEGVPFGRAADGTLRDTTAEDAADGGAVPTRAAVAEEWTVHAIEAVQSGGADAGFLRGAFADAALRSSAATDTTPTGPAPTDTAAPYIAPFVTARVLAFAAGAERS
ncbi:hypothetical protein ACFWZW_01490 [Microbacterium enclense]|uniref:hypothetical protein n=1 Tax=Microbacterium enclense TaxID=993073 RepID=UPI0036D87CEA